MKMPVIVLAFLLSIAGLRAQGLVDFNNRVLADVNGPSIDAPIFLTYNSDTGLFGDKVPGGAGYRAALYGGVGNLGLDSSLVVLTNPFTTAIAVDFRTTTATFGYVNVGTEGARTVPGAGYDVTVTLQIRAWAGGYATYEEAVLAGEDELGKSSLVVMNTSQVDDQEAPRLIGMQSFALTTIPEPSTCVLAVLGLAAWLGVRRRA